MPRKPRLPETSLVEQATSETPVPMLPLDLAASAGAPFIYFEDVPTLGAIPGVVKITLTAGRTYSGTTTADVRSDNVVVAYLRCNFLPLKPSETLWIRCCCWLIPQRVTLRTRVYADNKGGGSGQ